MIEDKIIPIKLLGSVHEGVNPIVVVGPNGCGKSKLGAEIVSQNPNSERISAKRNVLPPDQLAFQTEDQVKQQYQKQKSRYRTSLNQYSTEFTQLLFKLFAEESTAAMRFTDAQRANPKGGLIPPETTFSRIKEIWKDVFPKRLISIEENGLTIRSQLHSTSEVKYSAKDLSDGELVSFYMIARVLDAAAGIIVVDEPEIHLHSGLAKELWDVLQEIRSDIRFVYITHDLNFAESRRPSTYVILRPGIEAQLLESESGFPPDLVHLLLGAVTTGVDVEKIVFCEGTSGSYDERFYKAWFVENNINVVPVGNCKRVQACVDAINNGGLISGMSAIGIIDRDDRSNEELDFLSDSSIHVLPISEIENLLLVDGVLRGVALYLGIDNPNDKVESLKNKSIEVLKNTLNKRALERSKSSAEWKLYSTLHGISCDQELEIVKANFVEKINNIPKALQAETSFDVESKLLTEALEKTKWDIILQVFPGKSYYKLVKESFGVTHSRYFDLVCKALKSQDTQFVDLKKNIKSSLNTFLPEI
ncbi:MAG: AAA family ATPase [Halobacteriovoraceae bacterium]|jgi:ABC-type dipeptide/oligopeptide/nickel transport system ATPase subunit|nr:AAA family ATPase [Halobacteriovoraceae bacterium]